MLEVGMNWWPLTISSVSFTVGVSSGPEDRFFQLGSIAGGRGVPEILGAECSVSGCICGPLFPCPCYPGLAD